MVDAMVSSDRREEPSVHDLYGGSNRPTQLLEAFLGEIAPYHHHRRDKTPLIRKCHVRALSWVVFSQGKRWHYG